MTSPAYRLTHPITVVVQRTGHQRLEQLPARSVFCVNSSKPDSNGMIHGICRGDEVMMFSRDLEDRAEPIVAEKAIGVGACEM